MEVYSIGFTQTGAAEFFGKLKQTGIQRLVDVRLNNVSQLAGFAKRDDEPALHWLQMNNIHFADDPCWKLA